MMHEMTNIIGFTCCHKIHIFTIGTFYLMYQSDNSYSRLMSDEGPMIRMAVARGVRANGERHGFSIMTEPV